MAADTQPPDTQSNDLFGRWLAHHEARGGDEDEPTGGSERTPEPAQQDDAPPRRMPSAAVASAAVQRDPLIGGQIEAPSNFGARRSPIPGGEGTSATEWEPIVMRSARKKLEEAEKPQARRGRLQRLKARIVDIPEPEVELEDEQVPPPAPEVARTVLPPAPKPVDPKAGGKRKATGPVAPLAPARVAPPEPEVLDGPPPLPVRSPAPPPSDALPIHEMMRQEEIAAAAERLNVRYDPELEEVPAPRAVRAFIDATPLVDALPEGEAVARAVEPVPASVVAEAEPEAVEARVVEARVVEAPVVEAPVVEAPVVEAPVVAPQQPVEPVAEPVAVVPAQDRPAEPEPERWSFLKRPSSAPAAGRAATAAPAPAVEVVAESPVEPDIEPDIEPWDEPEPPTGVAVGLPAPVEVSEEPVAPEPPAAEETQPAEPKPARPTRAERKAAKAATRRPASGTGSAESVEAPLQEDKPAMFTPAKVGKHDEVAAEMPGVYKFKPKRMGRRLLTIALLIGLVASAYFVRAAVDLRDTPSIGLAAIVLLATAMVWAIRAGASVTKLEIHQGQLEVVQQGGRFVFDMASEYTQVEVHGRPGRHGWKVLFPRRGMAPFAIDATMVDPDDFMRVLRFFRPQLAQH